MESSRNLGGPKIILVLSGKRKSGKDFVADLLQKRYGSDNSVIIRLSAPLKRQYAIEHNLDYDKLLESSEYKEIYRVKMILWGEEKRNANPNFFCIHAIHECNAKTKTIWIVSDARRKTDLEFFLKHFPSFTFTLRIQATDDVRTKRSWVFTKGVDDVESECGLDDYKKWDFIVNNNENEELLKDVTPVFQLVDKKLHEVL